MGMGFAPTWLRQVSPMFHKTTLTANLRRGNWCTKFVHPPLLKRSGRNLFEKIPLIRIVIRINAKI